MSGWMDEIYLASPVWLQQAGVAAFGWWWHRRRYNHHFHQQVQELRSHETWTASQFRDYQNEKLAELLAAALGSPYYHPLLMHLQGMRGRQPLELLPEVPTLSKETLRHKEKDLLTQRKLPRGSMVFQSSGTTGTPSRIYYTPEFHAFELSLPAARNLGWAGVDYRARRVMFGVRKVCRHDQKKPPFWRFSPAENMAYASIYHLSKEYLPYYLDFLRSYAPAIVMGYPGSLEAVAGYAVANGHDLPPAQGVFTTSETVSERARTLMEAAWKCRVYDRYGAVEGCVFASQCEYGKYHVSPEAGILEIIARDGSPARPGELGRLVCTGLLNRLQPLIRYEIGDMARWAKDQNCCCNRQMPILEGIEGRYEDLCVTRDGRPVLRFDTVFKGIENICEAQVIQETPDSFTILVVPGQGYTQADARRMVANLETHVGAVECRVVPVEKIPRTAAGKFKAVISRLSPQERQRLLR